MERSIKGNGSADLLTLHPFRGNPPAGVDLCSTPLSFGSVIQ